MFAELKQSAAKTLVRIVGSTCLIVGGTLVFVALLAILTPLVLGLALLAMAGQAARSDSRPSQSGVFAMG